MEELGDKIAEADKGVVLAAAEELKAVLEGEDVEAIKAKTEALAQASMKMGEAMYQASAAEGGEGPGPDGPTADGEPSESGEDVVDADFEEIKDDDSKKSA